MPARAAGRRDARLASARAGRFARVMPTYSRRRASSISARLAVAAACRPEARASSTPTMYTRENSSPFVECSVSRFTRSRAGSTPSLLDSARARGAGDLVAERLTAELGRAGAAAAPSPPDIARRRASLGADALASARRRRAARSGRATVGSVGVVGGVALGAVLLEAVAVPAERERPRSRRSSCRFVVELGLGPQRERDAEVVEQMRRAPSCARGRSSRVVAARAQTLRQRARVVERAVRAPASMPNRAARSPSRRAARVQLARQRQRVVRARIGFAARRALEDREVELVAVVRDEHVVAAERARPAGQTSLEVTAHSPRRASVMPWIVATPPARSGRAASRAS